MDRLTALLAVAAIALGATTLWFAQRYFAERDRATALAVHVSSLESALEQEVRQAPSRRTQTPAADPTAGQTRIPDAAGTGGANEALLNVREREAQLMRNAQYRDRWLTMQTLRLRGTYAELQHLLGLSDSEFDVLLSRMTQFELEAAMRQLDNPLDPDTAPDAMLGVLHRRAADVDAARQQALRDALGDTRYRRWTDYQQTLPGRLELARWESTLALAGAPLTQEQAQSLLPVLVEQQRRLAELPNATFYVTGSRAGSLGAAVDRAARDELQQVQRRIDAQAEITGWLTRSLPEMLTPQQRELIIAHGNRELDRQRAQLDLSRLRFGDPKDP